MGMNIKVPKVHAMALELATGIVVERQLGPTGQAEFDPLLFKGDDFAATDVMRALPS